MVFGCEYVMSAKDPFIITSNINLQLFGFNINIYLTTLS